MYWYKQSYKSGYLVNNTKSNKMLVDALSV